jgi:hypothetical protein
MGWSRRTTTVSDNPHSKSCGCENRWYDLDTFKDEEVELWVESLPETPEPDEYADCMAYHAIGVYVTTRHYGGPEEGGWWYNRDQHVISIPFHGVTPRQEQLRLVRQVVDYLNEGDIYSVLGGQRMFVALEWRDKQHETCCAPRYE